MLASTPTVVRPLRTGVAVTQKPLTVTALGHPRSPLVSLVVALLYRDSRRSSGGEGPPGVTARLGRTDRRAPLRVPFKLRRNA